MQCLNIQDRNWNHAIHIKYLVSLFFFHSLKIYILLWQQKVRWLIAQAVVINAARTAAELICCKHTACALWLRLCHKGQFLATALFPQGCCSTSREQWGNVGLQRAEISQGIDGDNMNRSSTELYPSCLATSDSPCVVQSSWAVSIHKVIISLRERATSWEKMTLYPYVDPAPSYPIFILWEGWDRPLLTEKV